MGLILDGQDRDLSVYPGQDCVHMGLILDGQDRDSLFTLARTVSTWVLFLMDMTGTSLFTLAMTVSTWFLFLMDRSRGHSVYHGQDCVFLMARSKDSLFTCRPGLCPHGFYS
jgi:hypothetical protein